MNNYSSYFYFVKNHHNIRFYAGYIQSHFIEKNIPFPGIWKGDIGGKSGHAGSIFKISGERSQFFRQG